ncbi:hypothetical protein ELH21_35280 (plasmid) [Rhizobium leguminosarum]|uniref:inositol monophosphatase family protein n=1 Tax=Rhizobium TaxID=379 RepID=UPI0010303A33|nr:inositol monophosphatase family protein [Rhizobium beringeri]TBC88060.1 hypothetical protein ELH21_35280 [Rhizobium leguminosarum]WSG93217.1 inositol monophosphatase family protein [Rhizobium beringeri]
MSTFFLEYTCSRVRFFGIGFFVLSRQRAKRTTPVAGPISSADRSVEALLKERVAAVFSNDGFLGEEYGHEEGQSGYIWVVNDNAQHRVKSSV